MEKLTYSAEERKALSPFDKKAFFNGRRAVCSDGYVIKFVAHDDSVKENPTVVRDLRVGEVYAGTLSEKGVFNCERLLTIQLVGMEPEG